MHPLCKLLLKSFAKGAAWLTHTIGVDEFRQARMTSPLLTSLVKYGQSFFPKPISAWNGLAFAEAPSLAVFRSNFLNN